MDPLAIVVALALCATVLALILGLFSMGSGGPTDQVISTPLMWARVGLQGFTFVLLLAALFLRTG